MKIRTAENFTSVHDSCYSLNIIFVNRLRLSVRPGLSIHSPEQVSRDTLCCLSSSLETGSVVNEKTIHQVIRQANHPALDQIVRDVDEVID